MRGKYATSGSRSRDGRAPNQATIGFFTTEEIAFFDPGKTWKEIRARFGNSSSVLDRILEADCDEGRGLLWWCLRSQTWNLTDAGRRVARAA